MNIHLEIIAKLALLFVCTFFTFVKLASAQEDQGVGSEVQEQACSWNEDHLAYSCNGISDFETDFVQDDILSTVVKISIVGNIGVDEIPDGTISGYNYLESFTCRDCGLTSLNRFVFHRVPKLMTLDLSENTGFVCDESINWMKSWLAAGADNSVAGNCSTSGSIADYLDNLNIEVNRLVAKEGTEVEIKGLEGKLMFERTGDTSSPLEIIVQPEGELKADPTEISLVGDQVDFSVTVSSESYKTYNITLSPHCVDFPSLRAQITFESDKGDPDSNDGGESDKGDPDSNDGGGSGALIIIIIIIAILVVLGLLFAVYWFKFRTPSGSDGQKVKYSKAGQSEGGAGGGNKVYADTTETA